MKRIIKIPAVAAVVILSLVLVSCDKEKIISSSELPHEISTYISTHFPGNDILQVIKDREGLTKTYDVILSGNISLEFNRKNKIADIDGISKLPDSVIPEKIGQYVVANYPDNVITGWELDDKTQQIQLDNGLDLEFNMQGDFLRIDD